MIRRTLWPLAAGTALLAAQALPVPPQAPGPKSPAPEKVAPLAGEIVARTKDNKDVAFNLSNAKLYDIIQQVASLAGLNYTVDPAVKNGPVRLYMYGKLERNGIEDVLGLALKLNGVAVVRNGDFLEFVPVQASKAATPLVYGTRPADGLGESFVVTQIIPLRFLDAEGFGAFAKEFLSVDGRAVPDKGRNVLVAMDYLQNVRRVLDFVELMDKQPFDQKRLALFRLKNASPERLVKELEPILRAANVPIGTGALQVLPIQSLNSLLVITQAGEWLPDLKGWIDRFDEAPHTESGELFILPLKHAKAETVYPILTQVLRLQGGSQPAAPALPALQPSLSRPFGQPPYPAFGTSGTGGASAPPVQAAPAPPPSPTPTTPGSAAMAAGSGGPLSASASITVDTANNSLLVFGTQRDCAVIEDAVRKLDLLPRQVLIEATILDLTMVGEFAYGFSGFLKAHYNPSEINVNDYNGGALSRDWRIDRADPSGGFTYTLAAATSQGLLKLILTAKDSKTNTNVLSQPRLWALDNQPARLQVQDQIPIPVNTYVPGTNGGTGSNGYAVTNVQYLDTGLTLTVTPHINGSGVIRLEVQQEISSSSGVETLGSGQSAIQAPRISRRQLTTELITRDGDTVVLGGLIQQNKSDSTVGLPLLNRIPVLRHLFSTNSHVNQKSELVILLTPKVVMTLEDGNRVTQELRSKIAELPPPSRPTPRTD